MRTSGFILLAGLLVGCSTVPSEQAQSVLEADEAMVAGCEFMGTVSGSSGFGAAGAAIGMERSKNKAREQAFRKGATHVVWMSITGEYSSSASGKAYRC